MDSSSVLKQVQSDSTSPIPLPLPADPLREELNEARTETHRVQLHLEEVERSAKRDRLQLLVLKGENNVLHAELAALRQRLAHLDALEAEVGALRAQLHHAAAEAAAAAKASPPPSRWETARRTLTEQRVTPLVVAKLVLPTPVRARLNRIIGRD